MALIKSQFVNRHLAWYVLQCYAVNTATVTVTILLLLLLLAMMMCYHDDSTATPHLHSLLFTL